MGTLQERLQREASKKAHELFEMVLQGKLVPKDIEDALMSISTETIKEAVRVIEGERQKDSHIGIGGLYTAELEAAHNQALSTAITAVEGLDKQTEV